MTHNLMKKNGIICATLLGLLLSTSVKADNIEKNKDIRYNNKNRESRSVSLGDVSNTSVHQADSLFKIKKFKAAIIIYRKELKKVEIVYDYDNVNKIVFKMAKTYEEIGKYRRAESMYRRLIRRDFEDQTVYLKLGEVLRKGQKFRQSALAYIFYKNLKPHDLRWKYGLANVSFTKLLCSVPSNYRMRKLQSVDKLNIRHNISTINNMMEKGKLYVDVE